MTPREAFYRERAARSAARVAATGSASSARWAALWTQWAEQEAATTHGRYEMQSKEYIATLGRAAWWACAADAARHLARRTRNPVEAAEKLNEAKGRDEKADAFRQEARALYDMENGLVIDKAVCRASVNA